MIFSIIRGSVEFPNQQESRRLLSSNKKLRQYQKVSKSINNIIQNRSVIIIGFSSSCRLRKAVPEQRRRKISIHP